MRILLASPGLGLGGAERVVVSLASGLRARGHDVAVSGAAGPLDAQLGDVERLVLPERGRSPLGVIEWTTRQAAFVRSFRPHVVHAHNAKATVIAGAAIRLARGPRRPPLLATHHGAAADDRAGAAKLLLRAADEVVVVSEGVLPMFAPAVPRVIHNGIDPPPPGGDDAAREGVLFVGRLEPVKNPGRFLEVAKRVPEAKFVVVGDGSLREALDAPGVTFLGARDDARALLARAQLLLVTSDSEGQSIAVLEALAAGTPVVSTPVSGMRELDGVRIASFDPEDLAATVRELLDDPGQRAEMGAAGARLVRERFSADAMVDAYLSTYQALSTYHH
ncbi:glycosyltransferase family 4 protein [Solirubrobacter ginsenosidimutans]|uniref:Glycosyltransferase family 4 protein n=1 Tax=Solirubrobacter ginsenosidimutans TaxID=490573 RepID=A0A9X3MN86_9ACTN|nr:glycosyltransferase family 4 protein [Solirubrobacter ginsenosidimutans]MDA0159589.1 glycosyltransferase family 4 protein [Solirubrobacter ginsenosidimutans]